MIRSFEFNPKMNMVKVTFDVQTSKKCLDGLKKRYSDFDYQIIDLENER